MKHLIIPLAALAIFSLAIPSSAEAAPRCKTYTKTVWVDGKRHIGHGKACLSHGAWEIVKLSGPYRVHNKIREHIYDDLYRDGHRIRYQTVNNYYSTPYTAAYREPYKRAYKKAKRHYKYHDKHCND